MTDINNNLVSIVVPAYNAEKYIADAIESVLRQTYPYFELIIVDDASTDRTAEVVQSFSDQRIKLIRHASNKGPGAARNTAIEVASGKWMAVLDADDQWKANRLERLVGVLNDAGEGYFVADNNLLCFDTSSCLRSWRPDKIFCGHDWIDFDLCDYIKNGCRAIKPILPLDHIKQSKLYYNSHCFYGEDFEFICHLFRIGLTLRLINEPLYLYRITPGSLTSKLNKYEHLCEVYERLIAEPGFSQEEKLLFKELLAKLKEEIEYAPFPQALKQRYYGEALKLAIKRPTVLLKFLRRLPKSARYRLAAWKSGGKAR
ncbi:MAG: hypothetical protein PWQ70_3219 [Clostridiales bacterium]|nr:hypothetical protein [Clostridiales bacterium]